jgi:hypothetical protein
MIFLVTSNSLTTIAAPVNATGCSRNVDPAAKPGKTIHGWVPFAPWGANEVLFPTRGNWIISGERFVRSIDSKRAAVRFGLLVWKMIVQRMGLLQAIPGEVPTSYGLLAKYVAC